MKLHDAIKHASLVAGASALAAIKGEMKAHCWMVTILNFVSLTAVTFEGVDMYHNHESDDFTFEEAVLEAFAYATEEDHDDGLEEGSIPDCLKFPWSETEPSLSAEELSQIDAVAMQFEVDRLLGIPALERTSHALPGRKHLTTRFVVTWRAKSEGGAALWLRRARLVARDYAFLCPGRTNLFSPASSALPSKIVPAVFIANYHRGWQLVALDVADAYLNCPQVEDTCTSVTVNGERRWFRLLRLLPAQRVMDHRSGSISSLELGSPVAMLSSCLKFPPSFVSPLMMEAGDWSMWTIFLARALHLSFEIGQVT